MSSGWNLGITIQIPSINHPLTPAVDLWRGVITLSLQSQIKLDFTVNGSLRDSLGTDWHIVSKVHTFSEYEGEGMDPRYHKNGHRYDLTLREVTPRFQATYGRIRRGLHKGNMFISAKYGIVLGVQWATSLRPLTRLPKGIDPLSAEEERVVDLAFVAYQLRDKEACRYIGMAEKIVAQYLIGKRLRDGAISRELATDYLQILLPGDQLGILNFLEENNSVAALQNLEVP
jgi:hypothetical protein